MCVRVPSSSSGGIRQHRPQDGKGDDVVCPPTPSAAGFCRTIALPIFLLRRNCCAGLLRTTNQYRACQAKSPAHGAIKRQTCQEARGANGYTQTEGPPPHAGVLVRL